MDLGAWLVAEGHAVTFLRYSRDYISAETKAKLAGKGLWVGRFVMPWDWRRGERLASTEKPVAPATATRSADCKIKGNVSRKGARIFHVPGGRFYERTRIDSGKGERWFGSEAEALSAGWRPSRQ